MGKTWVIKNSDGYPKLEVEAESFVKAVEKVKDKLSCADLKEVNLSGAKGLLKIIRDANRVRFLRQEKGKEDANNYRRSDNNMAAD